MVIKPCFEIVEVADEYFAIPVGSEAVSFNGVVALNEATAYLLTNMKQDISEAGLVDLLLQRYNVDKDVAEVDVSGLVKKLNDIGLVEVS